MNTVKIENKQELVGFLRAIGTECRFVTVDTETVVENMPQGRNTGRKVASPKTGKPINEKIANPYVGTVKIARRNGFVNADFVTACEKRYAELNGLKPSDVTYTPGEVWYNHCMTGEGKPLCLCEHKKDNNRKYMQFFPIRNLGEPIYVHPTMGRLTPDRVKEMEGWMYADNSPEWKPGIITLAVDSIRTITFRKVRLLNDTASRLAGRLSKWKGVRVSTKAPLPVVAAEPA